MRIVIHAFDTSGRHLEFSMNDVIRGKIVHVAKIIGGDYRLNEMLYYAILL